LGLKHQRQDFFRTKTGDNQTSNRGGQFARIWVVSFLRIEVVNFLRIDWSVSSGSGWSISSDSPVGEEHQQERVRHMTTKELRQFFSQILMIISNGQTTYIQTGSTKASIPGIIFEPMFRLVKSEAGAIGN